VYICIINVYMYYECLYVLYVFVCVYMFLYVFICVMIVYMYYKCLYVLYMFIYFIRIYMYY